MSQSPSRSVEPNVDDPASATTLPQLIRAAATRYGDATAITLESKDGHTEALSFVELERQSALLARGLLARGVGKGSRVGFIYGNNPSFAVVFAAIARIGAVAVPVSTFIKADELVRVLRQSDVTGLIVQRTLLGKDYMQRVCDALPELAQARHPDLRLTATPFLRWVVSSGDSLPAGIRPLEWLTDASDSASEELLELVEAEVHPADQIVEIYTSGSMALPKGVRHDHGPTLFRAHFIRAMSPAERGQVVDVPMPFFWVGGLMMYLLPNWELGATNRCSESTSTNSRIAMGSVLAADDEYTVPEGQTIWALGMTETLGPYSYADQMRVPGYPLSAPLDHIADRFEIRVVDNDDRPIADGETGEIQVRGYALTPGLHKIERHHHFTADGFYRTGDMATILDNRILFVGRDGDIIKTVGSNVSPAEVELEMQQLPGVHSAYVVGLPDKERGQKVVAAVVPRDGEHLDFEEIQQALAGKLSSFKVPRAYVAITREEVPMLPSNKVARRAIEKLVAERLEAEGRMTG